MSYTTFLQLKNDLLAEMGSAPSDNEDDSGGPASAAFDVDGVTIMLIEMLGGNGEHAMLCADCGEVAQNQAADILSQVMTMNLLMYRDNGATFCTDPTTGRLLLVSRIAVASATVSGVIAMGKQFAKGVQEYQRNHFVSGSQAAARHEAHDLFARL